jgi:hypothetical protein
MLYKWTEITLCRARQDSRKTENNTSGLLIAFSRRYTKRWNATTAEARILVFPVRHEANPANIVHPRTIFSNSPLTWALKTS